MKGWIIAWIEDIPGEYLGFDLIMVHTYSQKYTRNLIKYLGSNNYMYKWCRAEGIFLKLTGDVVGHLKGKSKVITEVFGE